MALFQFDLILHLKAFHFKIRARFFTYCKSFWFSSIGKFMVFLIDFSACSFFHILQILCIGYMVSLTIYELALKPGLIG